MFKKIFFALFVLYILVFAYSFMTKDLLRSLPDFPDTATSIKVVRDYGIFGNVPNLQFGDYRLFGSTPPVVPFLGSLIPLQPLYSAALLSILAECIIAFFILKKYPNLFGFALIAILLINPFTSSLFPLMWRTRQAWALVFAISTFFFQKPWQQFLLSFLAFLSQPMTALLCLGFNSLKYFLNKEYVKVFIFLSALFLSIPFMFKLFTTMPLPPHYYGCQGYFLFSPPLILFYSFILFLSLHSIEFSPVQKVIFIFALFPIINAILFYSSPTLWQVFQLPLFADMCIDVIIVPFIVFSIFSNSIKKPFHLACLFLILSIAALLLLPPVAELSLPDINNAKVGTVEFLSSDASFYPIHSSFRYPSLQYLASKNITFACTPIPPQISKGPVMEKLARLECPEELDYAFFAFYGSAPRPNYSCSTASDGIRTIFLCSCRYVFK
ncbi:MAG: hypothetical protein QXY61_03295 [Candidatus Anstonellales archaeon]